jgi:hypothetical protein
MPNSWCSASIRLLRRERNGPRLGESWRKAGKHHKVSLTAGAGAERVAGGAHGPYASRLNSPGWDGVRRTV